MPSGDEELGMGFEVVKWLDVGFGCSMVGFCFGPGFLVGVVPSVSGAVLGMGFTGFRLLDVGFVCTMVSFFFAAEALELGRMVEKGCSVFVGVVFVSALTAKTGLIEADLCKAVACFFPAVGMVQPFWVEEHG